MLIERGSPAGKLTKAERAVVVWAIYTRARPKRTRLRVAFRSAIGYIAVGLVLAGSCYAGAPQTILRLITPRPLYP